MASEFLISNASAQSLETHTVAIAIVAMQLGLFLSLTEMHFFKNKSEIFFNSVNKLLLYMLCEVIFWAKLRFLNVTNWVKLNVTNWAKVIFAL